MKPVPDRPLRPDFDTLLGWLNDESPEAKRRVEEAARTDSQTRSRVDWLTGLQRAGEWVRQGQPPEWVHRSLLDAYDLWWARRTASVDDSLDLRLALAFDSRSDLVGAGARGSAAASAVHLAYSAEAGNTTLDLLLDIVPLLDHRVRIEGQLLSSEPRPGLIHTTLVGGAPAPATAIADSLGRFAYGNVPETARELLVQSDRLRLRVELDLRR